jgi:hypothetical protein
MFLRMANEEWRPIVGYEGEYEVSSLGRVRSLDRISRGRRKRRKPGKMLKPDGSTVYLVVSLPGLESGRRRILVHRLVAAAFLGPPPPERPLVDHINEDKRDNRACNLRYVDCKENRQYSAIIASSGVKHVHSSGSQRLPWQIRIGRQFHGCYATIVDAEKALATILGA